MLYAVCDETAPHIVRAFVNNHPPAPLPDGFHCAPITDDAKVDRGEWTVGMEWRDGGFLPYVPPPPPDKAASAKAALASLLGTTPDVIDQIIKAKTH